MRVFGDINTQTGGEINTTPATPSIVSNVLTIDASTANIFVVQHNANITTLTVKNQNDGQTIVIFFKEIGSGNTITWPGNFTFIGSNVIDAVSGQINVLRATYSVTLSTWVAMLDTNLGGSGTVTSVALADGSTTPIYSISGSPITGSGTLTFTLNTETANTFFAGPSTGSPAQPTFRVLSLADMPPPSYEAQVATTGQTVFNTTIVPTTANTGTNTYMEVFVNGVYQEEGATKAYTVTGANQITFTYALSLNSDVAFIGFT